MITLKSPEDIDEMREGGKILAAALAVAAKAVKPGAVTRDIDALVEEFILRKGASSAFKGYHPEGAREPYPAATCISVNEVIVHGLPSDYALQSGDVVTIDAGVYFKGWYTDAAVTVGVGRVAKDVKKLLAVTRDALDVGIKRARAGNTTGDIGSAIETFVTKKGFKIIKNLTGHGVGKALHEDPVVLNYGASGKGALLQPGMVIAIEPMVAVGSEYAVSRRDDSFVTHDGSLSAHFEHTIAITKRGPVVLTIP